MGLGQSSLGWAFPTKLKPPFFSSKKIILYTNFWFFETFLHDLGPIKLCERVSCYVGEVAVVCTVKFRQNEKKQKSFIHEIVTQWASLPNQYCHFVWQYEEWVLLYTEKKKKKWVSGGILRNFFWPWRDNSYDCWYHNTPILLPL